MCGREKNAPLVKKFEAPTAGPTLIDMQKRLRVPLAGALLFFTATTALANDVQASASEPIRFDALVRSADAVAVVTPLEQFAAWEDGRIYTHTRVRVEQRIAGDSRTITEGAEAFVRTRGGIVGDVGQLV